jgi:AcrR family transcriptional regulator
MQARRQRAADETVARILEVAEEQFRRVGYAKTAVADIARALGMSPANIYRFFPSKSAINEAIAAKHLDEVHALLREIVDENRPAGDRLEQFILELHRFNKSRCVSERCLHDMVTAAMQENWAAVEAHIAMIQWLLAELVADGIRRGEFDAGLDAEEAAKAIFTASVAVLHPALIAQFAHRDLEKEARRVVRFMLRALMPAPQPPPAGQAVGSFERGTP